MSTFWDLMDSVKANELILVEGGILQYYVKKDGNVTLSLIISTRPGAGSEMLGRLYQKCLRKKITLRCPQDSPSNSWWLKKGFENIGQVTTRKGTTLNIYEKEVNDG